MTGYRITDAERGTTTTPPVPHMTRRTGHTRRLARARARSLAPLIGSATACAAAARAGAVGGVAAAPRVARASAVRHCPPRPPRLRASPRLACRRRRAAARAADAARRGPALASRKRLGAARALHSTSLTPREVSMSTAFANKLWSSADDDRRRADVLVDGTNDPAARVARIGPWRSQDMRTACVRPMRTAHPAPNRCLAREKGLYL